MFISDSVLFASERTGLALCELFASRGYVRQRLHGFDEYALYAGNMGFLESADIVTFSDSGGRLMALRPDVTLSVARSVHENEDAKIYYHESVFRRAGLAREFREMSQCGIEHYGDLSTDTIAETLVLAIETLNSIGSGGVIDIAHTGLMPALLRGLPHEIQTSLFSMLKKRNAFEMRKLLQKTEADDSICAALLQCASHYGGIDSFRNKLPLDSLPYDAADSLNELSQTITAVKKVLPDAVVNVDFSLNQDVNYYSGVVFQGIFSDNPTPVLSGGRYDTLMRRLGKNCGAIGFAVYLDECALPGTGDENA